MMPESEQLLLAIYKNYLLHAIGASPEDITFSTTHMSAAQFLDAWNDLNSICYEGKSMIDGGRVHEECVLSDEENAFASLTDSQISCAGIQYIEKKCKIIGQLTYEEKLDIIKCIVGMLTKKYLVSTDVDEVYGGISGDLIQIVNEAEKWIQNENPLRAYFSENKSARIVFAENFLEKRNSISKCNRRSSSETNGEYLPIMNVREELGSQYRPTIVINLSKIAKDLHTENDCLQLIRGDNRVKVTGVVIHEISHYYDDISLPDSLWESIREDGREDFLRVVHLYSEMRSKYFQELYFIKNCRIKMADYVKSELRKMSNTNEDCKYKMVHYLGQILCWIENKEYINIDRDLMNSIKNQKRNLLYPRRRTYIQNNFNRAYGHSERFFWKLVHLRFFRDK